MRFGRVSGISKPSSTLVQGTVMLPGDDAQTHALLDAVLELGCNTFDTGHEYAGGDGERSFGRWLESRGVRDRIVSLEPLASCAWTASRRPTTSSEFPNGLPLNPWAESRSIVVKGSFPPDVIGRRR